MARNYINNKDFHKALKDYKELRASAAAEGDEEPVIPNYIGECVMKISTNLSRKSNFAGYTFREDMVSDAIEVCLKAVNKFDPEKYDNPFAYFTRVAWNAYIRRIKTEEAETYKKMKMRSLHDDSDLDNEQVAAFIEQFEAKNFNKDAKPANKRGVEVFMEE